MNAEQKELERIVQEYDTTGRLDRKYERDIQWLISQLKAAQEELTTAKALVASHEAGDAMLLEMLPGHATIAEGIQSLKDEIAALKSGDGLTTAWMLGFHQRDDEVRQLKAEVERLRASIKWALGCGQVVGQSKKILNETIKPTT